MILPILLAFLLSSATALNVTISNGVVTSSTLKSLIGQSVGTRTSDISTFIKAQYQAPTYSSPPGVTNPSVLNYLTLEGAYTANVPLSLPTYFFLVLNGAQLVATVDFVPTGTKVGADVSKLSVIVIDSVWQSGVIGTGDRSKNVIDCSLVDDGSSATGGTLDPVTGSYSIGPPGVLLLSSGFTLLEGFTIQSCGYGNGAVFIASASNGEISNLVIANAKTRGIWLLRPSSAIIHNCDIFNAGKFGIDLDAYSGWGVIMYDNYLHHNSYHSAILIEQGATFSVTYNNLIGPGNSAGVAFYNNEFGKTASMHYVIKNKFFDNRGAGVSIGSTAKTAGALLTTDSYILNNELTNNGLGGNPPGFGLRSNGPVSGLYFANNADSNGMVDWFPTGTPGLTFVNDYYRRSKLLKQTQSQIDALVTQPSALNATLINGQLTVRGVTTTVPMTCSSVNTIISTYFRTLTIAAIDEAGGYKNAPTWIWAASKYQIVSFLTVTGAVDCDATISLPPLFVLNLKDASITARPSLTSVVSAQGAYYSAVLGGSIDCGQASASGIYVSDSSYFTADNVQIKSCGSAVAGGAAVIVSNNANLPQTIGNNTLLNSLTITGSKGAGVSLVNGKRAMITDSSVVGSASAGIQISAGTGCLVSGSTVSGSGGDGIALSGTSTFSILVGNTVTSNGGVGINVFNENASGAALTNTVIVRNNITGNKGNSVVTRSKVINYGVSGVTVAGNTMRGNGAGINILGSVSRVLALDNDDKDSLTSSVKFGGGGTNRNNKNYLLDPTGRFAAAASPAKNDDSNGSSAAPAGTSVNGGYIAGIIIGVGALAALVSFIAVKIMRRRTARFGVSENEVTVIRNNKV